MPAALVLALALGLPHLPRPPYALNPFQPGPPKRDYEQTILEGGWRLRLRRDAFTGATRCELNAGGARFAGGVVTFSFGPSVDTANALFRVDGGAVRSAGEVGPEAAGLGAALLSSNTRNPSNGRVIIPWSQLKAAERVDVRPNSRAAPRGFGLVELRVAVEQARTYGCTDLKA